jgi:hypothetical protein
MADGEPGEPGSLPQQQRVADVAPRDRADLAAQVEPVID